jgi:hypothetical protein
MSQHQRKQHKPTLKEKIDNDFSYHAPHGDQAARYEQLRNKAKEFALLIVELTPQSAEQEQALQLLNLATMSANASIARNE